MRLCEVIVNITRRCDMACRMCIRGDPQNVDIDERIFPKLFEEATWIRRLCFTGGEPSMNLKALRQVVGLMEEGKCEVGSVFTIMNGKKFEEEFCTLFQRMVELCTDNGMTEMVIGTSEYHEDAPGIGRYMEWKRIHDVGWMHWRAIGVGNWVVNTGRAKQLGLGQREVSDQASGPFTYWSGEVRRLFLTCEGEVCTWCDISYEDIQRFTKGNMLTEPLRDIIERSSHAGSI